MDAINITGLFFFMPIFSFFLVSTIVYAILIKTKILGDSQFVNLSISLIMGIIFMSFSSIDLYVQTIVPWFVLFLVIVFFVLVVAGFATKDLEKIMTTKFAWALIAILLVIFLIAAIRVFNPIFHQGLFLTSGTDGGTTMMSQIFNFLRTSSYAGSVLLILVTLVFAWLVTRSK